MVGGRRSSRQGDVRSQKVSFSTTGMHLSRTLGTHVLPRSGDRRRPALWARARKAQLRGEAGVERKGHALSETSGGEERRALRLQGRQLSAAARSGCRVWGFRRGGMRCPQRANGGAAGRRAASLLRRGAAAGFVCGEKATTKEVGGWQCASSQRTV